MNGFQVVEALAAAFYGLIGLWAAVDPRHWFVRFAVMTGLLLLALFLEAYEVVVMFGMQIIIIVGAVWLARARQGWRPRLSLETALLTMVVVAVTAAVVARVPDFAPGKWAYLVTVGVCTAWGALVALWIVGVAAPFRVRIQGALLGLVGFLILYHLGFVVERALWQSGSGTPWQVTLEKLYQWDELKSWFVHRLPQTFLTMAILLTTLALARASRWFTARQTELPSPNGNRVMAARAALALMSLAVAAPMAYLFYELLTPTPLPVVELPQPNGYDDFIAAGLATPPSAQTMAASRPRPPRATLEAAYHDYSPIAGRIDDGLRKKCQAPLYTANQRTERDRDFEALNRAANALIARLIYLNDYGQPNQLVEAALQAIRFDRESERGAALELQYYRYCEVTAVHFLQSGLGRLDGEQCLQLAASLSQIEARREPFAVLRQRQLLLDENSGWEKHFQVLVQNWSGEDPYKSEAEHARYISSHMRLLIADAAAQAFTLERGRPPESFDELAPHFLPTAPADPFGSGPLHYLRKGDAYVIYSVGPDRDDDRGRSSSPTPQSQDYDIAVYGPHGPALLTALLGKAASEWLDNLLPGLAASQLTGDDDNTPASESP